MELANLSFSSEAGWWPLIKLPVLFGLLFYLGLSILIIRQVQLMTRTVTDSLDKTVQIVAWLHFMFAALLFLAVVVWY